MMPSDDDMDEVYGSMPVFPFFYGEVYGSTSFLFFTTVYRGGSSSSFHGRSFHGGALVYSTPTY